MHSRILTMVGVAAVTALAIPQTAMAQQDTTRRDTTQLRQQQLEPLRQDQLARRTDPGAISEVDNRGLEQSQVRRLQQALRDMGCNPGPIDGLIGPLTRRGAECARQRHGIAGESWNDLFRALNLDFTIEGEAQQLRQPVEQQLRRDTLQQQEITQPQQPPETEPQQPPQPETPQQQPPEAAQQPTPTTTPATPPASSVTPATPPATQPR